MPDEILPEGAGNVENLPVGQGKKRKGRPRKQRIVEAAAEAARSLDAAPPQNAVVPAVKAAVQAVFDANKRKPAPDPRTVPGIKGLLKELVRSEVRQSINQQVQDVQTDPGIDATVAKTIAAEEVADLPAPISGRTPRHLIWG